MHSLGQGNWNEKQHDFSLSGDAIDIYTGIK